MYISLKSAILAVFGSLQYTQTVNFEKSVFSVYVYMNDVLIPI